MPYNGGNLSDPIQELRDEELGQIAGGDIVRYDKDLIFKKQKEICASHRTITILITAYRITSPDHMAGGFLTVVT